MPAVKGYFVHHCLLLISVLPYAQGLGPPDQTKTQTECRTAVCERDAKRIGASINGRIDPCKDFYQYACRNWIERNPRDFTSTTIDLELTTKYLLANALMKGQSNVFAVAKAMDMYRLCVNLDATRPTMKPFKDFLIFAQLSFPPLYNSMNPWKPSDYDFYAHEIRYTTAGLSTFFQYDVIDDKLNSRKRILKVAVNPLLFVSRDTYEYGPYKIKNFLINLLRLFHINLSQATKDANDIIAFDQQVLGIEQRVGRGELRVNLKDWKARILKNQQLRKPSLNIPYWLDNVAKYINSIATFDYNALNQIIIVDPVRIEKYESLFNYYMSNNPRVLAIKAGISALLKLQQFLPLDVRNTIRKFLDGGPETSKNTNRELACLEIMPYAESRLYLDMTKFKRSRFINDMMMNIKAQLGSIIMGNTFMDPVTKAEGIKKVNNIVGIQDYEDWILCDKALNYFYRKVVVYKNQPMRTLLTVKMANFENKFKSLDTLNFPQRSIEKTYIPNAAVSHTTLKFDIKAALIQPPLYQEGSSSALNYGSIGAVIGHELGHSMDSEGRQYDSNGVTRNWWSSSSELNYQKQISCLINQYSRYGITTSHGSFKVNGKKTVEENIADILGIKVAYKAYMEYIRLHPQEPQKLPGLILSPEQLFFVSFAQSFCEKIRMNIMTDYYKDSIYPPDMFRVIGSLTGFKPFTDAFRCGAESRYRALSCQVWN